MLKERSMRISFTLSITLLVINIYTANLKAQQFYFGNDLSYVNQMEDCGADFKEWGESKDVYQIYADHGNNLVRVRLWNNPQWQNGLEQPEGVKSQYSNFEDVVETIQRSKNAGMQVLLDFHYSDFWADPGRQVVPGSWYFVAGQSEEGLADSVYNYTFKTLQKLDAMGLMPEMVQVGNETNSGMLRHRTMNSEYEGEQGLSSDWTRHAKMFNAGIKGVRDASDSAGVDVKIALHYAGVGSGLDWWFENAIDYGITDFDVIGFSYYYAWHGSNISTVASQVARLNNTYPDKEIVILETGYPWTSQNFDNSGNIITDVAPGYTPPSRTTQQRYMVDLSRAVMNAGGDGVIFWESAWVSTDCRTPWGQGSSHDHVAFFEPDTYDYIQTGGGGWMDSTIYEGTSKKQTIFRVNMSGEDTSNGVYVELSNNDAVEKKRMYHEGRSIYTYVDYLNQDDSGSYIFYKGDAPGVSETVPDSCTSGSGRSFEVTPDGDNIFAYEWGTCTSLTGETEPEPEITLTLAVDMTGISTAGGVYVTGDFNEDAGGNWSIDQMTAEGSNIYSYTIVVDEGEEGGWYFLNGNDWGDRETVPSECVGYYNSDRGFFIEDEAVTYAYKFGSCETFDYEPVSNEEEEEIPYRGALHQNYPNPFNPSTQITYEIEKSTFVELSLYNLLGQKVKTIESGFRTAGLHKVRFEAENLPSGTYLYKLTTEGFTENKKLMLIK